MTAQTEADVASLSYEEARDELVQVVNRLEQGGATLEESLQLWERGEAMLAATYVIGSVVLSLAALVGGLAMMRSMS